MRVRRPALARDLALALSVASAALTSACAARPTPYRFASPLLGSADIPPPILRDRDPSPRERGPAAAQAVIARGGRQASPPGPIRTATAPTINLASAATPASAAAADEVIASAQASEEHLVTLPAPHLMPADAPRPAPRSPLELRVLVGYRDARGPVAATLSIARELRPLDGSGITTLTAMSGAELVNWAADHDRLRTPDTLPMPGDLLVFDYTDGPDAADRIALVIAHDDARDVTEYLFLGGGVWRRAFLSLSHPHQRRDASGAILNSFLRTGSRFPPKGTHYLAGELLSHVIAVR